MKRALLVLLCATPAFAGRKGAVTATLGDAPQKVGGVTLTLSADRLVVKSGKKKVTASRDDAWLELVAFGKLVQLHGADVTVAPAPHGKRLDDDGAFAQVGAEADQRGIDYDEGSLSTSSGVIDVALTLGGAQVAEGWVGVRSHDLLGFDGAAATAPPAATPQGDFATRILAAHNQVRADHCAPALTWSDTLEKVAQKWADHLKAAGCAFDHSTTDYGENLAAGTSGTLSPEDVVAMWYDEIKDYDFAHGDFSEETGHFSQVVWKDTRSVGCGVAKCGGNDIFVCNYDPAGNVDGEYKANVLPKSCKE